MKRSYSIRLLALILTLVVLVQAVAFFGARSVFRDTETQSSQQQLEAGGNILQSLLLQRAQQLKQANLGLANSSAMQHVFARMERIVHTDSTILILGESGTGKELIARALHSHNPKNV